MFCPKCGTQLSDGAAFCPTCRVQIAAPPASTPPPAPFPKDPQSSSEPVRVDNRMKGIVTAAVSAVLILLGFLPIVNINLGYFGPFAGDYSLFKLFSTVNQIIDNALGYNTTASGQILGIRIWLIVLVVLWFVALVCAVIVIVNVVRQKKAGGYALILYAVYGLLCISTVFVASSILAEQLGSYPTIVSTVLSATPWIWLLTILAILGIIVHYAYKPKA